MYKMASVAVAGDTTRLWMCDARNGARAVTFGGPDEIVAALLAEGWEPFGVGLNGALWFRKVDSEPAAIYTAGGDHLTASLQIWPPDN